jgi:hypothetical protein
MIGASVAACFVSGANIIRRVDGQSERRRSKPNVRRDEGDLLLRGGAHCEFASRIGQCAVA